MVDLTSEPRIEVLSAADGARRRNWSDADKLRIVEDSCATTILMPVGDNYDDGFGGLGLG